MQIPILSLPEAPPRELRDGDRLRPTAPGYLTFACPLPLRDRMEGYLRYRGMTAGRFIRDCLEVRLDELENERMQRDMEGQLAE